MVEQEKKNDPRSLWPFGEDPFGLRRVIKATPEEVNEVISYYDSLFLPTPAVPRPRFDSDTGERIRADLAEIRENLAKRVDSLKVLRDLQLHPSRNRN